MFKRRSEMVSKNVIEEGNLFNKRRNGTEHSFEEWPEEVRGLKLGFKFHNMYYWRSLSTFRSIVEERGYFVDMEAPHSLWSTNNVYGDLLVALKEFKSIYGHLNVPPDFIVPIDKKNMNINNKDQNIMHYDSNKNDNCNNNDDNHNNNKEHNDKKLETPYFDYINSKEYRKSLIFDNAIKWSKKSQGLKLGLKVRHLRFRAKFLAKNREELTALGFDWRQSENNDKDVLDQTKNLDFDENY